MNFNQVNSIKEKISQAYLYSLAAKTNYAVDPFGKDVDSCGYDFMVVDKFVGEKEPQLRNLHEIRIQLKGVSCGSTSMYVDTGSDIKYNLSTSLPRWGQNSYLVIVTVPEESEIDSWVTLSDEELVLKKCAYYLQVPKGGFEPGFVVFPKANLLNEHSLKKLFENNSQDNY